MIKRAALGILAQAQRDGATELLMAPAPDGGTLFRYEVEGTWHDSASGGFSWPLVKSELGGLAGVRDAPYPKEGIIYLAYSGVRLRWRMTMANQDECILHTLGGEMG